MDLQTPLRGPAAAAAVSPTIAQLLAQLKQPASFLLLVSGATLEATFLELKFGAAQRAEVEAYQALMRASSHQVGAVDGSLALAQAVDLQRQQANNPWKVDQERAVVQLRQFGEDYGTEQACHDRAMTSLKEEFIARAKSRSLGHMETLVGQYLLFSSDPLYGQFLLMSMLLRLPTSARIVTHNVAIMSELSAAARESYGPAIIALTRPLFPHTSELQALNTAMMLGNLPDTRAPEGSGFLPVVPLPGVEGTMAVETTPLEDHLAGVIVPQLNQLREQIAQVAAQVNTRPPPVERAPRAPRPYSAPQQQQHQQQQYQQPQYQQPHFHQPPQYHNNNNTNNNNHRRQQQGPPQQRQYQGPPQQQQNQRQRRPGGGGDDAAAPTGPFCLDALFANQAPPHPTSPSPKRTNNNDKGGSGLGGDTTQWRF